jgi:hypothetical protein
MMSAARLARRDGDLVIIFKEGSVSELSDSSNGPSEASPEQLPSKGNINDDLLVDGLGRLSYLLDVLGSRVSDPSSNVDEANGGHKDITSVAIAESKAGICEIN